MLKLYIYYPFGVSQTWPIDEGLIAGYLGGGDPQLSGLPGKMNYYKGWLVHKVQYFQLFFLPSCLRSSGVCDRSPGRIAMSRADLARDSRTAPCSHLYMGVFTKQLTSTLTWILLCCTD